MKLSKSKIYNIIFFVIIGLLLFPQTRQPIQVLLNKGLALFSPSRIDESKQIKIENYNWKLKDKDAHVFNFEDIKGKVVLINFWATWCPPCIAEMPNMQLVYNDYKDRVEFIFVSNEAFTEINKFTSKNGYTFNVYNPLTKYPESLNVSSIPRTLLIDKNGFIVIDKTGATNWNSEAVRKILDQLLL